MAGRGSGEVQVETVEGGMSDTPRTDALVERNKPLDNLEAHNRMLDHARRLERELVAIALDNERLAMDNKVMLDRLAAQEKEFVKDRKSASKYVAILERVIAARGNSCSS